MSEQQMAALVERVGQALDPDVGRLVAGGLARGRARRARRRVATGAGVAATVALLVLAAPRLAVLPAEPGPAAAPGETPRRLAVRPQAMGATLAGLLPGATVVDTEGPYEFQVQRGEVRWRGVTVSVVIDTRGRGGPLTARERCEAFAGPSYCESAPRGAWVHAGGSVAVDGRTGAMGSFVNEMRVYVPGGFLVQAAAESGPPVSRDRLRRIALDDVWWR